jgi:hypothetical protein
MTETTPETHPIFLIINAEKPTTDIYRLPHLAALFPLLTTPSAEYASFTRSP